MTARRRTSTPRVKRHQRRRNLGYVPLPQDTWVPAEVVDMVLENGGFPDGCRDRATVRAAFELDFARMARREPPPE